MSKAEKITANVETKKTLSQNKMQKMSQKFLARQKKIKSIALKLFIAQGYENTSLKDIIKKSGGSFSDIYTTFKNKHSLFISVIDDVLEEKCTEYSKILSENLSLKETLLVFSLNAMQTFSSKKTLALVKIIYSQLYKQSNHILIEHFRQRKYKVPEQILIDYFKKCPPPLCDEAQKYAELFFIMLRGKCVEEVLLSDTPMMIDKEKQEEYAKFIVDFFLKALQ